MVNSVLQDWVMELPLREQGTLLTGARGCDDAPKIAPYDSTARVLVGFLRFCYMNPADPREVDSEPGCFFLSEPPNFWRPSEIAHFPLHWYSHLMHCFEVVAYRNPNEDLAREAYAIYVRLAEALHLNIETKDQMIDRLSEDRIEKGTVVS